MKKHLRKKFELHEILEITKKLRKKVREIHNSFEVSCELVDTPVYIYSYFSLGAFRVIEIQWNFLWVRSECSKFNDSNNHLSEWKNWWYVKENSDKKINKVVSTHYQKTNQTPAIPRTRSGRYQTSPCSSIDTKQFFHPIYPLFPLTSSEIHGTTINCNQRRCQASHRENLSSFAELETGSPAENNGLSLSEYHTSSYSRDFRLFFLELGGRLPCIVRWLPLAAIPFVWSVFWQRIIQTSIARQMSMRCKDRFVISSCSGTAWLGYATFVDR